MTISARGTVIIDEFGKVHASGYRVDACPNLRSGTLEILEQAKKTIDEHIELEKALFDGE